MGRSYPRGTGRVRRRLLLAAVAIVAGLLVASCGGKQHEATSGEGVLRIGLGADPVLEPGLALGQSSATILSSLMDPLVKLDHNLKAIPSIARSWRMSPDATTVTFHLRPDGRWTNGDPVTAEDFEYGWKRTLSPELTADYAYQLFSIVGAEEYSTCNPAKENCEALRERVGVRAIDEHILRVQLASPRPWFVEQAAHWAFLPIHEATVQMFGKTWWQNPGHIVTNGPFRLQSWRHDGGLTLVKDAEWRGAGKIKIERVEATVITDPSARLQAFRNKQVDALDGFFGGVELNPAEVRRLQGSAEFAVYPGLGTYYYGINLVNVRDPAQRKAMALALDRPAFAATGPGQGKIPATSFTPVGMPGYDTIAPGFLSATANVSEARTLMARVAHPKTRITLYTNDAPGLDRIANKARAQWKRIGISTRVRVLEWAAFLEEMGPPARRNADVFQIGWTPDYPDAMNFLGLWRCNGPENFTGYCDTQYDRLLDRALITRNAPQRWRLYSQLEARLTGADGAFPVIPVYWWTWTNLERESIGKTFNVSPFGAIDLAKVAVQPG
jgi:oligopeptide transport system substrate-binding protein